MEENTTTTTTTEKRTPPKSPGRPRLTPEQKEANRLARKEKPRKVIIRSKDDQNVDIKKKLQLSLRALKINAREKAFVDLVLLGWDTMDAYNVVGLPYCNAASQSTVYNKAKQLLINNPCVMDYYIYQRKRLDEVGIDITNPDDAILNAAAPAFDARKEQKIDMRIRLEEAEQEEKRKEEISDDEMQLMLSKDYQLKQLLIKLRNGGLDDNTEMQVRKMIADLTNAKKEQSQVEEKRTIFYLPLHCYNCSLFINS